MAFCSSGSAAAVSSKPAFSSVPEVGVGVEGDLAVEGHDGTVAHLRERVHLDEGGVLRDEGLPELDEDVGDGVDQLGRELRGGGDLLGLGEVDALDRVDRHLGERLGTLGGELLDLHPALVGGHGEEGAVGAVEQVGDVVLLLDVRARVDEHAVHRVALDVHAQDLLGVRAGVLGGLGDLDPAGLAAAADLHLRLDHGYAAEPRGDRSGLVGGRGDLAEADRDAVLPEQLLGLVLEQIHASTSYLKIVPDLIRPRLPVRCRRRWS